MVGDCLSPFVGDGAGADAVVTSIFKSDWDGDGVIDGDRRPPPIWKRRTAITALWSEIFIESFRVYFNT